MTSVVDDEGTLKTGRSFVYRLHHGRREKTMVLLHGSGVDETTLVPLAREIAPDAQLVAVRGRIMQEDSRRWFSKVTPTRFVQQSIRDEAAAFADFLHDVSSVEGFEPQQAVFLGYSNGANLASSVMLLHPGLIRRASLLRAMPVLDEVPPVRLDGSEAVIVSGEKDVTYGPFGPAIAELLSRHGVQTDFRTVPSGHEFGSSDAAIVRDWIAHLSAIS